MGKGSFSLQIEPIITIYSKYMLCVLWRSEVVLAGRVRYWQVQCRKHITKTINSAHLVNSYIIYL